MATITANTGSNNWNTNGAWVGSVQPTSADDVVIPNTAVVTIPASTTASCRSWTNQSGGTVAFAATTSLMDIGDATAGAGNVSISISSTSTVTLTAVGSIRLRSSNTTQQTIDTGGKTMPSLDVNVAGGNYLLSNYGWASTGTFTLTAGTFDTAGYNCSSSTFTAGGAGVKVLTLGTTVWTTSQTNTPINFSGTNLTLNPGTSKIITNPTANAAVWGGYTWNDVTFNGAGNTITNTLIASTVTRTGTASKNDILRLAGNITCTTFVADGNSVNNRILISSSVDGTSRTITAATVVSSYSDWSDITGAGAGSWNLSAITGGSGDALGNSGLTFTTAVDRYAMAAGNADSTAMWSATNGGSTGASIPLPQDDIYFTSSAGAGTYVMNMPRQGKNWNCTGFTRTLQASTQVWNIYGNVTLGAAGTYSNVGSGSHSFAGRGTHTITSNGSVFAGASGVPTVSINGFGGTYTLQDAMTHSTGTISILQGTFNTNNFSLTAVTPSVTGSLVRTVNLGTSTVTVTGASSTQWNATTVSNLTFNALSSTINIATASASAKSFVGGGLKYGTLNYTLAGSTGTFTITGNNYFGTINFSDASNARSLLLTSGTMTTVNNLNVNGTSGKLMSINAVTAGTPAYLDILGAPPTLDYLSVKDIYAGVPHKIYAGVNSTNVSGNTNIAFTAKPSPDGIYVNRYASIVSTTTSATITFPFSLTPTTGNVLVAFWHHNGNAGTVTPPSGWTAIDNINYSTTTYLKAYYKISDGTENTFTFTSTSSPSSTQIHVYSLAGFTGTATLDNTDKNSGTAITSLVTSGTPSSNTDNPAFAIAGFAGSNTMGASVSFTNSFLEGRGVTQQTMNRPVMKPLTSNGAVSTTYGWTTSRDATTILAVFKDVVTASNVFPGLLMMGVGQ